MLRYGTNCPALCMDRGTVEVTWGGDVGGEGDVGR